MKKWFSWITKIGNIRTALEKVYVSIKEGMAVMTYVKEGLQSTDPKSKLIPELEKVIMLCANINAVIAKILYVIGGTVDTSVVAVAVKGKSKALNVVDIEKTIRDLKDLVI